MNIFLALMDGFSLDYHNKSYDKLIDNLQFILDDPKEIH